MRKNRGLPGKNDFIRRASGRNSKRIGIGCRSRRAMIRRKPIESRTPHTPLMAPASDLKNSSSTGRLAIFRNRQLPAHYDSSGLRNWPDQQTSAREVRTLIRTRLPMVATPTRGRPRLQPPALRCHRPLRRELLRRELPRAENRRAWVEERSRPKASSAALTFNSSLPRPRGNKPTKLKCSAGPWPTRLSHWTKSTRRECHARVL